VTQDTEQCRRCRCTKMWVENGTATCANTMTAPHPSTRYQRAKRAPAIIRGCHLPAEQVSPVKMICPRCGSTHQYVNDDGVLAPVPLGMSLPCACGGRVVPVPATTAKRPVVRLVGQDGNAFNILGLCQRAAREAGWTPEQIKSVIDEMKSGDYDHLLQTAIKHFEVR